MERRRGALSVADSASKDAVQTHCCPSQKDRTRLQTPLSPAEPWQQPPETERFHLVRLFVQPVTICIQTHYQIHFDTFFFSTFLTTYFIQQSPRHRTITQTPLPHYPAFRSPLTLSSPTSVSLAPRSPTSPDTSSIILHRLLLATKPVME
jgi:hypothetical protein